jgi:predicted DNA-binding protein
MNTSVELFDLRAKITLPAYQVLDATSRATGRDKSDLVREILDRWAEEEIHKARLILRLTNSKGDTAA